jgi:hypothetical protein
VLNNMGNPFLARGNASPAREFYLKACRRSQTAECESSIGANQRGGKTRPRGAWVSGSPATNRDR